MSFEYPVHVFYREHRIDICIGNGFFLLFFTFDIFALCNAVKSRLKVEKAQ